MLIEYKKLIGIKVETESGQEVGKVSGFELETESQSIINYQVSSGFLKESLSINRGQIVSISEDKVVVEDSVIKNKKKVSNKLTNKKTAVLPAMKVISKK